MSNSLDTQDKLIAVFANEHKKNPTATDVIMAEAFTECYLKGKAENTVLISEIPMQMTTANVQSIMKDAGWNVYRRMIMDETPDADAQSVLLYFFTSRKAEDVPKGWYECHW